MSGDRTTPRAGCRVLIAGTGGQGVLTCAKLLAESLVSLGHHVTSGQLHGMAQRGGAVEASVIINGGDCPVIPEGRADVLLGFEPVEAARAIRCLGSDSVVFINTEPVVPFVVAQEAVRNPAGSGYPEVLSLVEAIRKVAPSTLALNASAMALEIGSLQSLNIVMLGCLLGSRLLPVEPDAFWALAGPRLPQSLREPNERAFREGVRQAANALLPEQL